MSSQRDPEGAAIRRLHKVADLADARVLDIGCGDGHLTWHCAPAARRVTGIDPRAMRLAAAVRHRPSARSTGVTFAQARSEGLPFQRETFDTAILSWSL